LAPNIAEVDAFSPLFGIGEEAVDFLMEHVLEKQWTHRNASSILKRQFLAARQPGADRFAPAAGAAKVCMKNDMKLTGGC